MKSKVLRHEGYTKIYLMPNFVFKTRLISRNKYNYLKSLSFITPKNVLQAIFQSKKNDLKEGYDDKRL